MINLALKSSRPALLSCFNQLTLMKHFTSKQAPFEKFVPEKFGLKPTFNLLSYAALKGKIPEKVLQKYLRNINNGKIMDFSPDCSIIPIPGTKRNIVSSIDFFYPTVKNPYLQGRIACCNVLSDLYAQGITKISTLLMVLGVSREMDLLESEIVTKLMIQGFQDTAEEAQTTITGGQSVWNPWPIIGGVGIASPSELEMIESNGAKPGDLLVFIINFLKFIQILTKPIGCQVIVNANQWLEDFPEKFQKLQVDKTIIQQSIDKAERSMGRLNLPEAKLMIELNAHCATDITGFGIKGHAINLVKVQNESVNFIIEQIPIYKGALQSEGKVRKFGIKEGISAETSGGLFISIAQEKAKIFLEKMKEQGLDAWIVGKVTQGNHQVIFNNVEFIEI